MDQALYFLKSQSLSLKNSFISIKLNLKNSFNICIRLFTQSLLSLDGFLISEGIK